MRAIRNHLQPMTADEWLLLQRDLMARSFFFGFVRYPYLRTHNVWLQWRIRRFNGAIFRAVPWRRYGFGVRVRRLTVSIDVRWFRFMAKTDGSLFRHRRTRGVQ